MKVEPIYSVREENPPVYHNDTRCTERNNIEARNIRSGTGGRRLCTRCASF